MSETQYTKLLETMLSMHQRFDLIDAVLATKADAAVMEMRFDRLEGRVKHLEEDVTMIKGSIADQIFPAINILDDQSQSHERRILTLETLRP